MPLQNRVNPFGEIIETPFRGTMMGNRGCIHDSDKQITSKWKRTAWVTCLLEYHGRHRAIMAPGQYTELFFLDEATALSAGHRPCGTCQKSQYKHFKELWLKANPSQHGLANSSIQSIDKHLHKERLTSAGQNALWLSRIGNLPDGSYVIRHNSPNSAWLIWLDEIHLWSPSGYCQHVQISPDENVQVVTPKSIVRTIKKGYYPSIHASAYEHTKTLSQQ